MKQYKWTQYRCNVTAKLDAIQDYTEEEDGTWLMIPFSCGGLV